MTCLSLFTLCYFPDDVFHMSGLHGQVTGVMELDAATQVYNAPSQGPFHRMIQPDVAMVVLDHGLKGTLGLCCVAELSTLAGDAVHGRCFQVEVILDGTKETNDLFECNTYSFDVMFAQHPEGGSHRY